MQSVEYCAYVIKVRVYTRICLEDARGLAQRRFLISLPPDIETYAKASEIFKLGRTSTQETSFESIGARVLPSDKNAFRFEHFFHARGN